jgi:type I restriction enzyme M protein
MDGLGFCQVAGLEEVRAHGHVLTPGRYVGAAEVEADREPLEVKIRRLAKALDDSFAESQELQSRIKAILEHLTA